MLEVKIQMIIEDNVKQIRANSAMLKLSFLNLAKSPDRQMSQQNDIATAKMLQVVQTAT